MVEITDFAPLHWLNQIFNFRECTCFQGFVKMRLLPVWQWVLGGEGTALAELETVSQAGFSTSQKCPSEMHGQLLVPPCSSDSWAFWRSWWVQECWFVWVVEFAQGTSAFFRALWGDSPVYSSASWYFTETLSKIHETLLESFDTTRNSRSRKSMWNYPSYFSASALRIQCSNCSLKHHTMIQHWNPEWKTICLIQNWREI